MENVIEVTNVIELISEIDSNKTIHLKEGDYLVSNLSLAENENVSYSPVFDGEELIIKNIKNLTITGDDKIKTQILAQPRYANVFTFKNCENITINNVTIGHTEELGYCSGGVISSLNSKEIYINNSILFGCGTYGLILSNTENLEFKNSVIKECSYGIMQINNSTNIKFNKSEFYNNGCFNLISAYNNANISFDYCKIYDNFTNYDNILFYASVDSQININNTDIHDNSVKFLVNNMERISINNECTLKNTYQCDIDKKEEVIEFTSIDDIKKIIIELEKAEKNPSIILDSLKNKLGLS